jgi:hypothetical protein
MFANVHHTVLRLPGDGELVREIRLHVCKRPFTARLERLQTCVHAVLASQGPTIPAEMLSKEYFTYYIILGILLGSIISLGCSTRTAPTRRFRSGAHTLQRFGPARAHARGTRIGGGGREPRIVATCPIVRPALPACTPTAAHCLT